MKLKAFKKIAITALCAFAGIQSANAEDFSLSTIQLNYTTRAKVDPVTGTGTSDEKLAYMRFDHFGVWKYGDNYIDLDLFQGKQVGGPGAASFGSDGSRQYFFVWNPRVSLTKPFGTKLGGFVKDVYATYRMERASYGDFRADNIGISLDLAVPGTAFFEQDFFARRTNYDNGTEFLSRTVWMAPFNIGSLNFHFDGLSLIKTTQNNGTDVLLQPDLLVDLLPKGQLQAGVRLEYHKYKGYSRTSPFLMLKWTL